MSKRQTVKFDLPLSDSVRGKSTLDGLTVAAVQMMAAWCGVRGNISEPEQARKGFLRTPPQEGGRVPDSFRTVGRDWGRVGGVIM